MTRYDSDGDCEGAEECEKGQWFTTGWSDCTATKCKEEGGEKKRKVWLIFLKCMSVKRISKCLEYCSFIGILH